MAQPLSIHWVVQGVQGTVPSSAHSPLASNRYRVILPAQALGAEGQQITFIEMATWSWPGAVRPDVVIVGKLLSSGHPASYQRLCERVLANVAAAQAAGVPVLADVNDDHFQHPLMGAYWRRLVALVDLCVAGTEAMGQRLRQFTQRPVRVIGDPVGSPWMAPRVFQKKQGVERLLGRLLGKAPVDRIKLAWYGNPVNWPAMERWAEALVPLSAAQPWLLWVVTRPDARIATFIDQFNQRHQRRALIQLEPWDEATQWQVVADADIVLIPSDPEDPTKAVKTSNRLTDALHAGRYVVASALPSYQPYAPWVALVDHPLEAVRRYCDSPDAFLAPLQAAQTLVAQTLAPQQLARQWQDAISLAVAQARAAGAPPPRSDETVPIAAVVLQAPAVRLNLGCGDKILPGYVNVDVVASRRGQTPDVLCDLKDLSVFESNSADEILAVHVVEHFWRWEIEDTLREWVRVLKPGGQMVLECPNLISACEEFLRDPAKAASPGPDGQRTMWVFYGDPAWKDPYMIHRWGYTPQSLSQLMESVGLVRVHQAPAQFKLREPRDMRVVGYKPG